MLRWLHKDTDGAADTCSPCHRLPLLHRLLVAPAHLAAAVLLQTVLLRLAGLAFIRTVVERALSVRLLLGPRLARVQLHICY